MVAYKCKMCAANLDVTGKNGLVTCEYCGTQQTYPIPGDEKKANLFNRANNLRMKCDFDRAARVYEMIVAEFPEEAEAYWGLCLCNYGIEYVDDPQTKKKIPTCHRASYTKLAEDDNYQQAIENADINIQKFYRDEAREIDRIMEEIVAIGKNEKPYDIFICYKETDDDAQRTLDSVLAQDIYDTFVSRDYKVFFSRITLEDKLGREYEPYIFSALNSAKVMLVVGMKYENLQGVWVKNEWSRFLKLIKKDKSKVLIPCYKDMDPYDLPDEFRTLQAQDMGKVGAMQDLVRGVEKIIRASGKGSADSGVVDEEQLFLSSTILPILKRANACLNAGDFSRAESLFDMVLNFDPENAQGHLGKLLVEYKYHSSVSFESCEKNYKESRNYSNMMKFADDRLKTEFEYYDKAKSYRRGLAVIKNAQVLGDPTTKLEKYKAAIGFLSAAKGYSDAQTKLEAVQQEVYDTALKWCGMRSIDYKSLGLHFLEFLGNYKDCPQKVKQFREELDLKLKKRKTRHIIFGLIAALLVIAGTLAAFYITENLPGIRYNNAVKAEENGETARAAILYAKAGEYEDAKQKSAELWSEVAERRTLLAGDYFSAAIKKDGSLKIVTYVFDYMYDLGWKDLVALSELPNEVVALKSDGTVVSSNEFDNSNFYNYSDVVAIDSNLVLKSDGTVSSIMSDFNLSLINWKNIVKIADGGSYAIGLTVDGEVKLAEFVDYEDISVEGWTDIVAIDAGCCGVGLRSDGTLCVTGNDELKAELETWTDIVSIDVGESHVVGLKADGTVVAAGSDWNGQLKVEKWKDIVSVSAGAHNTLGLKADGKVIGTKIIEPDPGMGTMNQGQSDVKDFKDIRLP